MRLVNQTLLVEKGGVFLFKRLEPLRVCHVHHSILLAPSVPDSHGYLLLLTEALLAQFTGIAFA